MTRDRRRKQRARALTAARGLSYHDAAALVAARPRDENVVLAQRLQDELIETFTAAGIPAAPTERLRAALYVDVGCGQIDIQRVAEPTGGLYSDGDELDGPVIHPDDPARYDLTGPIRVEAQFPFGCEEVGPFSRLNVGFEVARTFTAGESAAPLAALIGDRLASGRRHDMRRIPRRTACSVCGDPYPFDELLDPAHTRELVCPHCFFDSAVVLADPAKTVIALSESYNKRLSTPVGWSAVCALLAALIGGDLTEMPITRLRDGSRVLPGAVRDYTGWLWLPPAGRSRPPALDGLACATTVNTVVERVAHSHPQLRDQVKTAVRQQAPHLHATPGLLERVDPTVDRLWTAIIAYAIAIETHRAEHPSHRGPWQVTESLDFVEWINELRSDLHYLVVQAVMRTGILTVQAELFPNA